MVRACRVCQGQVLVEYVKDKYYARFHNPSTHLYRETHDSILLDVKY